MKIQQKIKLKVKISQIKKPNKSEKEDLTKRKKKNNFFSFKTFKNLTFFHVDNKLFHIINGTISCS